MAKIVEFTDEEIEKLECDLGKIGHLSATLEFTGVLDRFHKMLIESNITLLVRIIGKERLDELAENERNQNTP